MVPQRAPQAKLPPRDLADLQKLYRLEGKALRRHAEMVRHNIDKLFERAGQARKMGSHIFADKMSERARVLQVALRQALSVHYAPKPKQLQPLHDWRPDSTERIEQVYATRTGEMDSSWKRDYSKPNDNEAMSQAWGSTKPYCW